jgi:hypothetical protein
MMTEKQLLLLERLKNAGGALRGDELSRVERSMASRMAISGIVSWRSPFGSTLKRNLDSWTLSITEKGSKYV